MNALIGFKNIEGMVDNKEKVKEVIIAGRPYPVEILHGEEQILDNALKSVHRDLTGFKKSYGKSDDQDVLAMTLLTYAMDLQSKRNHSPDLEIQSALDKIDYLEELIDKAF